jgi:hypothetical protein
MEVATLDPAVPPTLPALTAGAPSLTLSHLGAAVTEEGSLDESFFWLGDVRCELPLLERHLHIGGSWDFASAERSSTGQRSLVLSNPTVWIRGVGYFDSGVAAGGGIAFAPPMPDAIRPDADVILPAIRSLEPWDSGYFAGTVVTVRPFLDARVVMDPVMLQLEQGFDLSYATDEGIGDLVERVRFYAGVDATEWLGLGIEVSQAYAMGQRAPADDRRATFTLEPSVRFRFGPIEPAVGALFPLTTPLEGAASRFFGARFSVRLVFEGEPDVPYPP